MNPCCGLGAVVDRGYQEDRGWGEGSEDGLRSGVGHGLTLSSAALSRGASGGKQTHLVPSAPSGQDGAMSASAQGLADFIDASPSPFHVCRTAAARLTAAGYTELAEADPWPAAGRFFTVRAGSLIAWDSTGAPDRPFRVIGGHTDSPNLRVKQNPDRVVAGWRVVALQPYGGVWLNSWLDRDLGISGRLSVRSGAGIEHRLVRVDEPILRVPQLAIHLAEDRAALKLDPQRHVNAVWALGDAPRSFVGFVAERADIDPADVLGFDLMTHDLTPSLVWGAEGEFLSAARLDNQATCYAGLEALLAAPTGRRPAPRCRYWRCSTTRRWVRPRITAHSPTY